MNIDRQFDPHLVDPQSSRLPTVLVCGGGGFIGRHLVARLNQLRCSILLLQRPSTNLEPKHQTIVDTCGSNEIIVVDGWTEAAIMRKLGHAHIDFIINLAASGVNPHDRNLAEMEIINSELPGWFVKIAKDKRSVFVNIGSSAEYAEVSDQRKLVEDSPLETNKWYGCTKARGNVSALQLAKELDVTCGVLRLFNVFGPGESAHRLFPTILSSLRSGDRISMSAGTQVRDFVYIDDVIDAIIVACQKLHYKQVSSGIWNICSGRDMTVKKFADDVAAAFKHGRYNPGFGDLPLRDDDLAWVVGDPSKARDTLGWHVKYGISQAVARTVAAEAGN